MHARVIVLATVLTAAGLAGCIGSDDELDPQALATQGLVVSVTPESGDGDTVFTFDASGTPGADALTFNWDFGDGQSATGQVVDHQFAYTNNLYKVTLEAVAGNETFTGVIEVPVGSGENAVPSVSMEADRGWVAHDDPLTVRASASDPDGDPVEIEWLLTKDQSVDDGHDHDHGGSGGGSGFGIPESTGQTGPEATFSFDESGTYRIVAQAMDPKGGKATDSFDVKVTHTVPKPTFNFTESGTLTAGTAGANASLALYGIQQPAENSFIDSARYDLRLIYPGSGDLALTWSDPSTASDLDAYLLTDNGKVVYQLAELDPQSSSASMPVDLSSGSYVLEISANSGAQIEFSVALSLDLKIPGLTVDTGHGDDGHDDHDH